MSDTRAEYGQKILDICEDAILQCMKEARDEYGPGNRDEIIHNLATFRGIRAMVKEEFFL